MLRIIRGPYQVGVTNITSAAGAIGTTLQNGDQLYFMTTSVLYATVTGNALTFATN